MYDCKRTPKNLAKINSVKKKPELSQDTTKKEFGYDHHVVYLLCYEEFIIARKL